MFNKLPRVFMLVSILLMAILIIPNVSALASDGLVWNTTAFTNITRNSVSQTWEATSLSMLRVNNLYYTYYTTPAYQNAYLATSTDGITWTDYNYTASIDSSTISHYGQITTSDVGDTGGIFSISVVHNGTTFLAWYSTYGTWRIYLATSPDGLTWTKYNATVPKSSDTISYYGQIPYGTVGKADVGFATNPSVYYNNTDYLMWYRTAGNTISMAVSHDGYTWNKINNAIPATSNTVSTDGRIPKGVTGGDTAVAFAPSIMRNDTTYLMSYSGQSDVFYNCYLATSLDGYTWNKVNNTEPPTSITNISYYGQIESCIYRSYGLITNYDNAVKYSSTNLTLNNTITSTPATPIASITLNSPANGSRVKSPVTFNCSVNGLKIINLSLYINDVINFTLAGGTLDNRTNIQISRTLIDGSYNYTCKYINLSGNEITTYSYYFIVDSTSPVITSMNSTNGTTTYAGNATFQEYANVTINATATDTDPSNWYSWFVNGVLYLYGLGENVVNFIATQAINIVTVKVNDTAGNEATENRQININEINPIINLTTAITTIGTTSLPVNITLNYTSADTNLQACFFNATGIANTIIPCNASYNVAFSTGGQKILSYYANDSSGNTVNGSVTFNILNYSAIYTQTTTEGSTELIKLSINVENLSITAANLSYNNIIYAVGITDEAYHRLLSSSVTIPDVTINSNLSFHWIISLSSGLTINTSSYNQSINPILIDDCSAYSTLILNYTLYDEDTKVQLNATTQNTSIEVDVSINSISGSSFLNASKLFNRTLSAQICTNLNLTSSYSMDVIASYKADGYAKEYHNLQSFILTNASIPQNIELYDLLLSRSTAFKITIKDDAFLALQGAIVNIQRKYISEGLFRSIEIPKTDNDGKVIGHMVVKDEIYTIIVSKNGVIVQTFRDIIAICENPLTDTCEINLNAFAETNDPVDYINQEGVSYDTSFDESSRIITVLFNSNDGSSKTVSIETVKFDRFGNETVCSDALTSSSGALLCTIPSSFGNLTAISKISVGGKVITTKFYSLNDNARPFGTNGVVMVLVLLLSIPFMFLSSMIGVLISFIIILVMASLMMLFDGGSILGTGSFIMWFIIAIGIISYRIVNRNKGV